MARFRRHGKDSDDDLPRVKAEIDAVPEGKTAEDGAMNKTWKTAAEQEGSGHPKGPSLNILRSRLICGFSTNEVDDSSPVSEKNCGVKKNAEDTRIEVRKAL